jgi:chromosome segregation ATPase
MRLIRAGLKIFFRRELHTQKSRALLETPALEKKVAPQEAMFRLNRALKYINRRIDNLNSDIRQINYQLSEHNSKLNVQDRLLLTLPETLDRNKFNVNLYKDGPWIESAQNIRRYLASWKDLGNPILANLLNEYFHGETLPSNAKIDTISVEAEFVLHEGLTKAQILANKLQERNSPSDSELRTFLEAHRQILEIENKFHQIALNLELKSPGLIKQNESLREQILFLQTNCRRAKNIAKRSLTNKKTQRQERQSAEIKVKQLTDQLKIWESLVASLNGEIERLKQEVCNLSKRNVQQALQLGEAGNESRQSKRNNRQLQARLRSTDELVKQLPALMVQLTDLREQFRAYEQLLDSSLSAQANVLILWAQDAKLFRTIREHNQHLQSTNQELSLLLGNAKTELAAANLALAAYKQKNSRLFRENNQLGIKLKNAQSVDISDSYADLLAEYEERLYDCDREIADLDATIENLNLQNQALSHELRELDSKLQNAIQENLEIKQKLAHSQSQADNSAQKAQVLTSRLTKSTQTQTQPQATQQTEGQVEKLTAQLQAAHAQNQSLIAAKTQAQQKNANEVKAAQTTVWWVGGLSIIGMSLEAVLLTLFGSNRQSPSSPAFNLLPQTLAANTNSSLTNNLSGQNPNS